MHPASGGRLFCPCVKAAPVTDAPKDGVFIHLTAGPKDSHRVLMANLMAVSRGVLVYCDIHAIEVVLDAFLNFTKGRILTLDY